MYDMNKIHRTIHGWSIGKMQLITNKTTGRAYYSIWMNIRTHRLLTVMVRLLDDDTMPSLEITGMDIDVVGELNRVLHEGHGDMLSELDSKKHSFQKQMVYRMVSRE